MQIEAKGNSIVIFSISDGTAETSLNIVRAVKVQFENADIQIERFAFIRETSEIEKILLKAKEREATVVSTLVSHELRIFLTFRALQLNIKIIDILFPLLEVISEKLSQRPSLIPGLLRQLDNDYFKRILAIEFTVRHDDGLCLYDLGDADIVLLGISRTSKTPLSMYLGHKGYKVANIPIVVNSKLPDEIYEIDQDKVVGLIIDSERLQQIRLARLDELGSTDIGQYADTDRIFEEIEWALEIYKRNKRWPVLDVTAKAIEENAVKIERIILSKYPNLSNTRL